MNWIYGPPGPGKSQLKDKAKRAVARSCVQAVLDEAHSKGKLTVPAGITVTILNYDHVDQPREGQNFTPERNRHITFSFEHPDICKASHSLTCKGHAYNPGWNEAVYEAIRPGTIYAGGEHLFVPSNL